MREALFIKKNKERWQRIQHGQVADADELATEFTRLIDDLSYAKTFYPGSRVTNYVNSLASRIYLDIYRNRKERSSRLVDFWKYDLPMVIRKHHRVILLSTIIFIVFAAVAFVTASRDEEILNEILGQDYVDMTRGNIRDGNPFGVYENENVFVMWLRIMINNIGVAVKAFISGIFFGIPTLYILASNSFMVGAFDQLFYREGLGLDFFLVVFIHGTLELTAIILAAGAGLILGKGFLLPGTLSRLDSVKMAAKEGAKIIIGLFPVFALAAFFEGFITRLYNDVPVLTILVVVASIVFVVWYFIIYPFRVEKKLADKFWEERG